MTSLPHCVERSLVIRAPRPVVFAYFTDSARFARWWGEGSSIEGRVGGEVVIRYPNDVVARGRVEAIEPDREIVFTYGYEGAHPELPAGGSRITIRLEDRDDGTLLQFRHDLPEEKLRDQHVPGWRYHLAVFANVAANEHHADAGAIVQRWFEAWAEADGGARAELLAKCTHDDVSLRDAHACLTGRDELHGHIANTQRHLPGLVMQPQGAPRHCQGHLLVDWSAAGPDGGEIASGTVFVRLAPDGRIAAVVGF